MERKQNSKKGFSFPEVMITIFVVAIVLVLYIAAANTIRILKTSKDQEIALRVANNKVEELRAGGYDNLPASGSFSSSQLSTLPNSSGTMTITDFNARTKQVQITVEWREPSNTSARNVSLVTLVTRVGGI
jgi:prepilin-type N-terminal cleavage/methylation domain-containing protein